MSTVPLPSRRRQAFLRIWTRINSPARILDTTRKALRLLRRDGLCGLWRRVVFVDPIRRDYEKWIGAYDLLQDHDRDAIRAHIRRLHERPLLSVVLPVYNTPERWLRLAIASVRAQLYENWQLCIADDASSAPHIRPILAAAAAADPRIRVVYREQNGGIAAASNSALALATGSHVGLLDHDDELSEHALYIVAAALDEDPALDILYSDEDKLDERGRRCLPYFKPDWNPELLLNQHYLAHFIVYRRALLDRIGRFRMGFDGSQDFDLILRAVEHVAPERIRHLPFILYHWRMIPGSTAQAVGNKSYAVNASRRAIEDALQRRGTMARVEPGLLPDFLHVEYPLPDPEPLVSILIPTRDKAQLLKTCVDSLFARTLYRHYEVLILDNGSVEPATHAYFEALRGDARVRVIPYPHPFNYAAINNFGANAARGEILCLMNNDIEAISPGWLTEMVGHALRPGIGAVGARLLYPDTTLQHAGIVLGYKGGAGHAFKHYPAGFPTMGLLTFVTRNVSGVTAACMVLRKSVYDEVKGLDERFVVAFNDVDFCLRLVERGYHIVWTPYATLYHHESATRGPEDRPEQAARFQQEMASLRKRSGMVLDADPAYNPNLTLEREDNGLAFPPRVRKPWQPMDIPR